MTDLTATFDVPDSVDPTLTDPVDVVGTLLDVYNEWARAHGEPELGLFSMSAEWDT
jgi:hypothetical protein